jgi:hypothetical protein
MLFLEKKEQTINNSHAKYFREIRQDRQGAIKR